MRIAMIASSLLAAAIAAAAATAPASMYNQQDIQTLNQSVTALSSINPQLSSQLKTFSDKASGQTAQEDQQESAASQAADVQTLRNSADALRSTHPDLASDLDSFAAREAANTGGQQAPVPANQPPANTQP